jgi:hypothetical protein
MPSFLARTIAILIACLSTTVVALAGSASFEFAGADLQRLRAGNAGQGQFVEYGRRLDGVSETLTIKLLSDGSTFKDQVGGLIRTIKARNPQVKVRVLEKPNTDDVIVVYLPIREGSATTLILWRLSVVDGHVISSIYQMDFDIDNDDAKDRVIARSAEHALARLDTATIANLLSNTP